jgi:ABC-type antimicrobial peptide transport system permease subunit
MKSRFLPETPLAWSQLSHQKVRLAVALGGIAFANVLIFMQLGFKTLFEDGATSLPASLHGDLFLLNPTTEFIGASGFDRIRLSQAASVKGVKTATALHMGFGPWGYSKEFTSFGGRFFGYVLMSEDSYAYYFGDSALQTVSVGIITLEPGTDLQAAKAGITAVVPGIKVYTAAELVAKELTFQESNPTGPIFGFGALMGIIVGVVIVYQVLYADVIDHLAEYATLKAN